jgi:hypothetical protein
MTAGRKFIIDGMGKQIGAWSLERRFLDGFETKRASPRGFIHLYDVSSISDGLIFEGLADYDLSEMSEYFLYLPSLSSNDRQKFADFCASQIGGVVQANWPIVTGGERRSSTLPARLFREGKPIGTITGYEGALLATDIAHEFAEIISGLQSRIEHEAAACALESGFSQKYGMRRILTVGSTSRNTYFDILVDFDLVIETEIPQAKIAREDIERTVKQIVARVVSTTEFASYCGMIGQSSRQNIPFALRQSFFGVRGKDSFVSRHEIQFDGNRHNLIDFTIGRLPQLIGYEVWIQRFLGGLSSKQRIRVTREIRLAKKLLTAMGELYGVGIPGFRGNVVEQLIIQGWDYRSGDGSGSGSLDNSLKLIFEESEGSMEGMPFAEFKTKFPLWHPGWWESEVGFSRLGQGVNILDLLGGGKPELAEQQWKRVNALATSHSEICRSNLDWSVSEVVGRAKELLVPS